MSIKYTDKEIIDVYKQFAEKLGRTPTQTEVNEESKRNKRFPNGRTIFRRFGGLFKLNEICGFKQNYNNLAESP